MSEDSISNWSMFDPRGIAIHLEAFDCGSCDLTHYCAWLTMLLNDVDQWITLGTRIMGNDPKEVAVNTFMQAKMMFGDLVSYSVTIYDDAGKEVDTFSIEDVVTLYSMDASGVPN